jgi:hypothetical protein
MQNRKPTADTIQLVIAPAKTKWPGIVPVGIGKCQMGGSHHGNHGNESLEKQSMLSNAKILSGIPIRKHWCGVSGWIRSSRKD